MNRNDAHVAARLPFTANNSCPAIGRFVVSIKIRMAAAADEMEAEQEEDLCNRLTLIASRPPILHVPMKLSIASRNNHDNIINIDETYRNKFESQ